jgi:tetratricopeptide (TPR) repeat protein
MSSQILSKRAALGLAACALLAACSAQPTHKGPPPHAVAPSVPPPGASAASAAGASATGAPANPAVRPEVPPAARADFERAVRYMRAGNVTEAELGFKQIALQYPQFAAPLVDLGLLQRKQGQLEQAEASLQAAVAKESGSAVAWTELGVTQRMRGEFKDAAASYEQAIAADAHYAPAWRNLGVLADLYLGDPNHALAAFEQYKALTGEDKPVSGWIAAAAPRMPAPKRPEAPAAARGRRRRAEPGAAPPRRPLPGAARRTPPRRVPGRSQEHDHAHGRATQGRARRASLCSSACSAPAARSRSGGAPPAHATPRPSSSSRA